MKFLLRTTIFFSSLLLSIPILASCERSYTLAYNTDYVPYQYHNMLGRPTGLDIEIAQLVLTKMGCELIVKQIPPKRAQKLIAEGALDLMPAASITEQRQQYAHFSLPYREEKIVMFVKRKNEQRLKALNLSQVIDQGLFITAGLGGWYGKLWEKERPRADASGQLVLTNSTLGRIKMLLADRVSIVLVDSYVGYYHSNQLDQTNQLVELPQALNTDPAHFMLSQKSVSEQELAEFNQALQWVLKSDQYQAMLANYLPQK